MAKKEEALVVTVEILGGCCSDVSVTPEQPFTLNIIDHDDAAEAD